MPLGHLGINVQDMAAARAYYDELMPLLGFTPFVSDEGQFSYRPVDFHLGQETVIFFYPALEEGEYSRHKPGLQHLAFAVPSRARVQAVHDWAVARGAEIIEPPREFPQYHPGYYATFWYSPERFMLEAVCHRDQEAG